MRTRLGGALVVLVLGTMACGDRGADARERMLERAEETTRRVAAAEWHYDRELRPPERGGTAPVEEDRCRVTLPGETAPVDVACGFFLLALEPEVDSVWVHQLVDALGGVLVDWTELPAWATRLDEPVPYVMVSVPTGSEGRAIRRAAASEGVRFVDVRRIQRRRP